MPSVKLSELAKNAGCWSGEVTDHNSTVAIAVAIALAESRGVLTAKHKNNNGTTDFGLWQINSVHVSDPVAQMRLVSDAGFNAQWACKVYGEQGWHAWSTFNNGAYKLYLGQDKTVETGSSSYFGNLQDSPANAIQGAVNTAKSAADGVSAVAGALMNPSTYLRLGKGTLGGVFIIVGAGAITYVVAKQSGVTEAVAKAAEVAAL